MTTIADLPARVAAYAPTDITADLGFLSATEHAVLDSLVSASRIMHEIFIEQAWPGRDEMMAAIDAYQGQDADLLRTYLKINSGPWDRRFHFEPFVGGWEHPKGANFYPTDLTPEEESRIIGGSALLTGLTSMVRRDDEGRLSAIPYSEYFHEKLGRAAGILRHAADLTQNMSLKNYLEARSDAFMNDDYFASDMLWMDLDSPVEITIGPYETYEDGYGYKASFESFVTVTDPQESARLAKFKDELPWLEAHLPIPDQFKNPNRGSDSPIRVVDEVFTAGDTRSGVQTIAFNLPNDERVREAKGSKKVLLRNIMNAKFDQILTPIAEQLLVADQIPYLKSNSFFQHTLWHEMSHGLGPGRIVIDGRETEVRLELGETYSTLEEAKADAMGPWCIFHMMHKGYFPDSMQKEQAVTYLAGLFRSVRFGVGEAHGAANAIQFNYLRAKGVITSEGGHFRIDAEAFPAAIENLVHDILMIQAQGDLEAAKKFIATYGILNDELTASLATLAEVPVDILPIYAYES